MIFFTVVRKSSAEDSRPLYDYSHA